MIDAFYRWRLRVWEDRYQQAIFTEANSVRSNRYTKTIEQKILFYRGKLNPVEIDRYTYTIANQAVAQLSDKRIP